jgi:diaminohydroxyphosphoribosylaminopyrimidine deaminase/5-amino-6-(5-phosphoribosylamino)uracil reductase
MRWQEWQKDVMGTALELARLGKGRTYPNPAVGAVLVKGGEIVGRGFHRKWGMDHAEVAAMKDAGKRCGGADLYVTLEPCCHYGKTPPCTEAIIRSGIRRVFTPTLDPNPLVNGKGIEALKRAGIPVQVGVGAEAAMKLNEAYFKFMKEGEPFVTLKIAQTLDGRIATASGRARWITSSASRKIGRAKRSEAQAILVGARTVALDDPLLLPEPRRKENYFRCVLDTHLGISLQSRIVRTAREFPVIVYSGSPEDPWRSGFAVGGTDLAKRTRGLKRRKRQLEKMGVLVKQVGMVSPGSLSLRDIIDDLASMKIMHLWVEGGSAVFTSFMGMGVVDKILAFIAPKVMGDGGSLSAFEELGVKTPERCFGFSVDGIECIGDDLMVTLYPAGRRGAKERVAPNKAPEAYLVGRKGGG